jgi:hypothetical protein
LIQERRTGKMRGRPKAGEDKVENKTITEGSDRPQRTRRSRYGSSRENESPGGSFTNPEEEAKINKDLMLQKVGIGQDSNPAVEQATGEEGKGENESPGMVNQYADHTIPTTAQLTGMVNQYADHRENESPGMVNQYADHTIPTTVPLTEEQIMWKAAFDPSEDDSDNDVSLQEDYKKSRSPPNKGPIKHQLVISLKNVEIQKKLLQDKSDMLHNTEQVLSKTQLDKDKLTKEIRVVATENRRIADLVAELAVKEKAERRRNSDEKEKLSRNLIGLQKKMNF